MTFLSIFSVGNICMLILYIHFLLAHENDLGGVETSWFFIVTVISIYCKISLKGITQSSNLDMFL